MVGEDLGFKDRVLFIFQAMKNEYENRPGELSVPIFYNNEVVARLRPLHNGFTQNEVEMLMRWRNQNKEAFFTWADSTEESTRDWLLNNILSREDRILFFAETLEGLPFGQIGLTNFDFDRKACELDNWIRDPRAPIRGGMTLAIQSLMDWVFFYLQAEIQYARVFTENEGVISRHQKNGLVVVRTVVMKRIQCGDVCRWVETEENNIGPPEKKYVLLEIRRSAYNGLNHAPDYRFSTTY